jgi:hypothetical protein
MSFQAMMVVSVYLFFGIAIGQWRDTDSRIGWHYRSWIILLWPVALLVYSLIDLRTDRIHRQTVRAEERRRAWRRYPDPDLQDKFSRAISSARSVEEVHALLDQKKWSWAMGVGTCATIVLNQSRFWNERLAERVLPHLARKEIDRDSTLPEPVAAIAARALAVRVRAGGNIASKMIQQSVHHQLMQLVKSHGLLATSAPGRALYAIATGPESDEAYHSDRSTREIAAAWLLEFEGIPEEWLRSLARVHGTRPILASRIKARMRITPDTGSA